MGSHVGETVRKGITSEKNFADEPEKLMLGMFCVCISVTFWLALATKLELPVSTTHSAIGGIIGMTIVAEGWSAVKWEKVTMVVASWFISPAIAMAFSSVFFLFVRFALLQVYPCCKDKKKNPKCASKWCSPFFRTLMFYPLLLGFCCGVQVFFIIYKGSPQLKLKTTPLWVALLVAIGVGAVGAIVGACLIPVIKYCAEWTYAEEQRAELDAQISLMEGGDGAIVGEEAAGLLTEGDGSDLEMKNQAANVFPEEIELTNTVENKPTNSVPATGRAEPDGGSDETPSTPEMTPAATPATAPATPVATATTASATDVVTDVAAAAPLSLAALKAKRTAADAVLMGHPLHKMDVAENKLEEVTTDFALKVRNGVEWVAEKGLDADVEILRAFFPLDIGDPHDVVGEKSRVDDIHQNLERFDAKAEATFKFLQVLTACAAAFGHGANDVANAISPFAAVWSIYRDEEVSKKVDMPIWILAMGGAGIVVGLALYGHIIIRAIGVELVALTPSRGFSIELASASVVVLASRLGWPVSSTHCQVGAEVGVGILDGAWPRIGADGTRKCTICASVNWRQLVGVFFGWVITIVIAGGTSGGLFAMLYFSPSAGTNTRAPTMAP